ncbi:hypothetical protein PG994_005096 [Apiospora phragmitis]|uniref:Uncharacterized protein n=1 Tax=Apiospora phragmitis TaxID=2905665 RepID=A0ABR1VTP8_9PEZI
MECSSPLGYSTVDSPWLQEKMARRAPGTAMVAPRTAYQEPEMSAGPSCEKPLLLLPARSVGSTTRGLLSPPRVLAPAREQVPPVPSKVIKNGLVSQLSHGAQVSSSDGLFLPFTRESPPKARISAPFGFRHVASAEHGGGPMGGIDYGPDSDPEATLNQTLRVLLGKEGLTYVGQWTTVAEGAKRKHHDVDDEEDDGDDEPAVPAKRTLRGKRTVTSRRAWPKLHKKQVAAVQEDTAVEKATIEPEQSTGTSQLIYIRVRHELDTAAGLADATESKATSVAGASKRKHEVAQDDQDSDDAPAVSPKQTRRFKGASTKKN